MPEFQRFDPASCHFPRPRVALLPALRWADLGLHGADRLAPALLDGPRVRHFSRGRYALHAAYRLSGVGPAGALLAPAYHCRTMLDPALALGGAVRFYHVNPDLSPSLDSIKAGIGASALPVRALVVPHYFGVEQPPALMQALAALCEQHGITLVEDCSHAWQVAATRAHTLQEADPRLVVASPYKHFACEDGGVLWGGARVATLAHATPASLLDEAKALKGAFSRSGAAASAGAADAGERGATVIEHSDQPSPLYQRTLEQRASLALSRWVMRRTRLTPLIERRRQHYRAWSAAVAGIAGARALFPALAADCVPYMFPIEIAMPDPFFFQLKQAGLPIWRWDDMALSDCAVASRYRLHLLHLPCHQDLTPAQMDWMTSLFAKVLA
jgi:perosamine synthetase